LAEVRSNELLHVPASISLATLYAAKDDWPRAREMLKSLEAKVQNPALLREIQNAQALFSIRDHDISPTGLLRLSLDWWVKMISDENQNILHLQKEREAFTLMRLQIAEGKAHEALNLLEQWGEDAAQNGRIRSQAEAFCLEALAYHATGNVSEAAQSLSEALTIGQAKGLRRIFLDERKRMAALLQAVPPTLPNRTLSLFASTLLHSFPPETLAHLTATRSEVQIEPLSPQEMRVLRLLVAGLSNADIAQELVVSTNTIKTQVKSIYRKLNVSSRNEAREVSRELKLI
jgi:LuxR family maltose regulon positive regulatory protein